MLGISPKLFARQLTAIQADVERAETLLNRDGLILHQLHNGCCEGASRSVSRGVEGAWWAWLAISQSPRPVSRWPQSARPPLGSFHRDGYI